MAQPQPAPVDPAQLPQLAAATMLAAKFPMLATMEGDQPRLRPISPIRTEGFTIYVANLRSYGKTKELQVNPKVELCYCDAEHNQVRITGQAEVITDRPLLEDLWAHAPLLRAYLGSLDNPELIIYRIIPQQVRYMKEWALSYNEVPL